MNKMNNEKGFIFGHKTPAFRTEQENLNYYMALMYQVELVMGKDIYTVNTCLASGVDIWCASYCAGIIDTYNSIENKQNVIPAEYSRLSIHVYLKSSVMSISRNPNLLKQRMQVLHAATTVYNLSGEGKSECERSAIEASTHMLVVYPEGVKPFPVSYAEKQGLEVIRLTPLEVVFAFRNPEK